MRTGPVGRALLVGLAVVAAVGVGVVVGPMLAAGDADVGGAAPAAEVTRLDDRVPPDRPAPLPEVTLPAFSGDGTIALADYRGKPLVVNFWATWCAPCVTEMPDFQQVASRLASQVAFLGVNVQDAPANARAFVEELDITYDLALDREAALYRQVRAYGMPTTLLVDSSGTVVYRHTGALDADRLATLITDRLDVPA